ncbi:MAG: ArsC/Spx/MgsR family protein [Candidatus Nitrosocaldus sp.]
MDKVSVYHYSKCITCRRSIDILSKEHKLELRDIFKDRLSKDEIRDILTRAGISARELVRRKSKAYKDVIDGKYSEEQIIEMMSNDPSLIERPIIIMGGKVFIRPRLEKI